MSRLVQFTQVGLAEILSAKGQGWRAEITHIAVGDKSYIPSAAQTQLQREVQREPIAEYEKLSVTQLRLCATFRGSQAYEVREIGFFLASGTLLAVCSAPDTLFTYKATDTSWIEKFTLDISPLPEKSVVIKTGLNNLNLMLATELIKLSTAQITTMGVQIEMNERLLKLENGS